MACMADLDGDGWGDDTPGPGVDPGTDCDDGNGFAFPGAAENESPSACMEDTDGDGWATICRAPASIPAPTAMTTTWRSSPARPRRTT
jgi:hypothetical protein